MKKPTPILGLFLLSTILLLNIFVTDSLADQTCPHGPAQYGFAHRVNDWDEILGVFAQGANGIEIDICYSTSMGEWYVSHYDLHVCAHATAETLDEWLNGLGAFSWNNLAHNPGYDAMAALWVDVKTPGFWWLLPYAVQQIQAATPADISVVYELGTLDPESGKAFEAIKDSLRENEGVMFWAEEIYHCKAIYNFFRAHQFTRNAVDHGHALDIDEDVLIACNDPKFHKSTDPFRFKQVFTFTNYELFPIFAYVNPDSAYCTSGQILGDPLHEWPGWLPHAPQLDGYDAMESFFTVIDLWSPYRRLATRDDVFWPKPQPPEVEISLVSQTVQCSDGIAPVTITAKDPDSLDLGISVDLPGGLHLTKDSCINEDDILTCTWTLDGRVLVVPGIYDFTFVVSDGELESTGNATLTVECGISVVDNDDDGYFSTEDCDDDDPQVNPGADEICDGKDNDCNGRIDGLPITDPLDVERLLFSDFGGMDLIGSVVRITSGPGVGKYRTIVDNNDSAALVNEAWLFPPLDSSSTFAILEETSITGNILLAMNAIFPNQAFLKIDLSGIDRKSLLGKTVEITSGWGVGQTNIIIGIWENPYFGEVINVLGDWDFIPNSGSTYRIVTEAEVLYTGIHDPFGDGYCIISNNSSELCDGWDNDGNGIIDDNPIDIDDGNLCTIDECVEGVIVNSPVSVDDGVDCTVDNCDTATGEIINYPSDALCDDGFFCNGLETCDAINDCQAGSPPECSQFDLSEIATCENDPDGNPFTWDSFPGFTSICDEVGDACTTGSVEVISSCSVDQCGAECDDNSTWEDYCAGDERHLDGICDPDSCSWSFTTEDCNELDNWYYTGNTRIVPVDQSPCDTKEQKEQEFRDYTCGNGVECIYDTTDTRWVDTGVVYDNDGDDDGVCTEDDACVSTPASEVVNEEGCSIPELCPCDYTSDGGKWKNHGAYVSCVAHISKDFLRAGLITKEEKHDIISMSAKSICGHKKKTERNFLLKAKLRRLWHFLLRTDRHLKSVRQSPKH